MKSIWRFTVSNFNGITLSMPRGARVLSVIERGQQIALYALVDTEAPHVERTVIVLGTGWDADSVSGMDYVGTVSTESGSYVWHVFIGPELKRGECDVT